MEGNTVMNKKPKNSVTDKIQVSRTVHRPYSAKEGGVFAPAIGYVSARRPVLSEIAWLKMDKDGVVLSYRSEDNGRTWSQQPIAWKYPDKPLRNDSVLRIWAPGAPFVDPEKNIVFRVNYERAASITPIDWKNFPKEVGWNEWGRTLISYSYDEGNIWTEPEVIVADGAEYNPDHPLPDVWWGRNACLCAAPHILKLHDGTVLMLFTRYRLWPNGKVRASNGDIHYEVFAVRATWNEQSKKLVFKAGQPVENDYNWSKLGMVEPAVAETEDGRLIMIARTQWPSCEARPIVKFICESRDGGRTWSLPEPLRYEDGELVGSCASYPNLIRSVKNGKFYYISNILAVPLYFEKTYSPEEAKALDLYENPQKISLSDPRNKLHIAELNPDTLRIKRDTVTLIDQRWPGEPAYMRISNWAQYEDRETGNIVLYLTRDPGNEGSKPNDGISRDLLRYDIVLPDKIKGD